MIGIIVTADIGWEARKITNNVLHCRSWDI